MTTTKSSILLPAAILGAVLFFAAKAVRAEGLCAGTMALIAEASAGFPEAAELSPLAGAESCTMALALSGARSYHCAWRFPYRDGPARAAFEAFRRELETCLDPSSHGGADQRVNHPDSYDQRRFMAGAVWVTLSLKDKAALRSSYVFLGVEGAAP